jgi:Transposase DDE domain
MAQRKKARLRPLAKTFLDSMRQFLTPAVWKQAHQARRGKKPACGWELQHKKRACRWEIQPLVLVLVLMTWSCGDSQEERFEAAKAFCVICRPKQKRPGGTVPGFQKALARLPMQILWGIAAGIRQRLMVLMALATDGFIPLGCDGSRLTCPRTRELEKYLCGANPKGSAPSIWVTAVVHLRLGVPWCWRWGKGTANERDHLLAMLPLLPAATLLVADAGYIGFELAKALSAQMSFLIRQCSLVTLYTETKRPLEEFRDGVVLFWTKEAQKKKEEPLRVRLLCVRRRKQGQSKSQDVWLMTNVMDKQRLTMAQAGQYYRWRWENEGLFRTYKRTLKKMKLESRTIKLVHREAEGSMLALQLLLAQGALAMPRRVGKATPQTSPRKILLAIRAEIRLAQTGRRGGSFGKRLREAQREQRVRTTPKEARAWATRAPHTPPKPPKILKVSALLKAVLDQLKCALK